MRKDRHVNVDIIDEADAKETINSPYFIDMTPIDDQHYEVRTRKKSILLNLPIQIGIFVYGYAKLRLLRFYHDFLLHYIDPRDFQAITCDTDSLYIALAHPSLEDAVKPELKNEFRRHRHEWLPTLYCPDHLPQYQSGEKVPPGLPCCVAAYKYHTRTPGLWKVECKADKIVALAPKSYICSGQTDKISCKGVQKRINPLTAQHFQQVLETKAPVSAVNRGFRLNPQTHTMNSYVQSKTGLSYLYIKRKVLEDGVSTLPLDV